VLTIGKFDGVHLGHRVAIFGRAVKAFKQYDSPAGIMILEPRQESSLRLKRRPAALGVCRDKVRLFGKGQE